VVPIPKIKTTATTTTKYSNIISINQPNLSIYPSSIQTNDTDEDADVDMEQHTAALCNQIGRTKVDD
jgi:hypothetical protein